MNAGNMTLDTARIALLGALALTLCGPGCVPTRDAPQVRCTNDSFCPSDGFHFCNTATNLCQRCDGPCNAVSTDAGGGSSADSTGSADTTGSTDSGASADSVTEADVADDSGAASDATTTDGGTAGDAASDDTTATDAPVEDAAGPATPGSCAGWCGNDDISGDCYCDSTCLSFGDCCADYLDVCGVLPPEDATVSGDVGIASDATGTGT